MNENVIGFDISMNDVLDVHELESLANLFNETGHLSLGHFLSVKSLCQTAIAHILHHQINEFLIVKKAVQVSYVTMSEE